MADAIWHRGPDEAGFFVRDGVGLAIRRLSIIDVGGGHQPVGNEDRQVQVVLCEDRRGNCKNSETKSKRLELNCFHDFGGNPSQIFGNPLPLT